MMTKYFVTENGDYIGAFCGSPCTVPNCVEVQMPPEDARQKYDFSAEKWLPISGDDYILIQINALESQQTSRRVREAALGIDNGWLADINDQIASLRNQLKKG